MARYTTGSLQSLESSNYVATIEENYLIFNKRITLSIKNKKFLGKGKYYNFIKIPFKIIPNSSLERKEWDYARRKIKEVAFEELNRLEKKHYG
ncbi:MAG: hypothetical protein GQ574_08435 [Crocinitomix sp.]|nr:hypothetical protein [Crocinitomix sp.]